MKRFVVIVFVTAILFLVGCQTVVPTMYAQHVWDFRGKMIYENTSMDDFQKINEVFAVGAVLKKSDSELMGDLKQHGIDIEEVLADATEEEE